MDATKLPEPAVLPVTGKSRFNQFKKFIPISREKFRQLVKEGRAPQPTRDGIRCTYYDNAELHKWLADPINYKVDLSQPSSKEEIENIQKKVIANQGRMELLREQIKRMEGNLPRYELDIARGFKGESFVSAYKNEIEELRRDLAEAEAIDRHTSRP